MSTQTKTIRDYDPAIYVGTYAKYNQGNLSGDWLYPLDYSDRESFIEACVELHKDEQDCEYMFQDWQNIPFDLASECDVSSYLWELEEMDEYDRDLLSAYVDATSESVLELGPNTVLEFAQENYIGSGDRMDNILEDYATDCGLLDNVPDCIKFCIDWELWGRDQFWSHYYKGEEWIFSH